MIAKTSRRARSTGGGAARGCVPVQVALAHKHLGGAGFDPPQADVLIMGHILHDRNLQEKHLLLQKAFAALPKHGTLIVYDAMIDDARCHNAMGLLMSLNMLIETPGGFDYTPADCRGWMKTTGFRKTSVVPLTAVESMVIATK